MRRWREAVLLIALAGSAPAQDAKQVVSVSNASVPTACAETDNVTIAFASDTVRRLSIEARHPHYADKLKVDQTAPDFSRCDMSNDPSFAFTPRTVVLYDGPRWRLVGHSYARFWRRDSAPVRVGARREDGLHLIQLWTQGADADEVLVLYPADGYWRAHPLAAPPLTKAAYGSSFLIGPIEQAGRPLVALADIAFDPDTASFQLGFARGGSATLSVSVLDRTRIRLAIDFDRPITGGPFAALRSMDVSDDVADVARLAWRGAAGPLGPAMPIMDFKAARAAEVWTGRLTPSRHNTSAPDMVFKDFAE